MNIRGFNFINSIIILAIVVIIVASLFLSIDPWSRARDNRDAQRWSDITDILTAIKIDQIDNGGDYMPAVRDLPIGRIFMITNGAVSEGCSAQNEYCTTEVKSDVNCVNLAGLVSEGYLLDVPVSPEGLNQWSESATGYTLEKDAGGRLTVRSCESENSNEISITR